MTLWQWGVVLAFVGGGAYTYIFQPMALELGLPRAQCWWQGGVYLRSTENETGYSQLMTMTPINAERLKKGEAQGCFPSGECVAGPTEANAALEQQMVRWVGQGGGQLLAGNIMAMVGMDAAETARAKQSEAQYCLEYLGKIRRELPQ